MDLSCCEEARLTVVDIGGDGLSCAFEFSFESSAGAPDLPGSAI